MARRTQAQRNQRAIERARELGIDIGSTLRGAENRLRVARAEAAGKTGQARYGHETRAARTEARRTGSDAPLRRLQASRRARRQPRRQEVPATRQILTSTWSAREFLADIRRYGRQQLVFVARATFAHEGAWLTHALDSTSLAQIEWGAFIRAESLEMGRPIGATYGPRTSFSGGGTVTPAVALAVAQDGYSDPIQFVYDWWAASLAIGSFGPGRR